MSDKQEHAKRKPGNIQAIINRIREKMQQKFTGSVTLNFYYGDVADKIIVSRKEVIR